MADNPKNKIVSWKKQPNPRNTPEVLVSGETARQSGLYKLQHDSHRVRQEIFIRKGTVLPACNDCGNPIKFTMLRQVEHIDDDPDFG